MLVVENITVCAGEESVRSGKLWHDCLSQCACQAQLQFSHPAVSQRVIVSGFNVRVDKGEIVFIVGEDCSALRTCFATEQKIQLNDFIPSLIHCEIIFGEGDPSLSDGDGQGRAGRASLSFYGLLQRLTE